MVEDYTECGLSGGGLHRVWVEWWWVEWWRITLSVG